ncbi:all3515 family Zur-repressed PEP-CTERM protein [Gloeothece verrucosa]|uniref:PEP-CTERM sorting domain-containing protein n=1 Tax=Gloeothece verrucosa (strain PCC 7822) TaxID=497965 RepID=E0UCX4_GLOV7|nr:all3515 family Zur-repressed PEP-CTERM protein [Gloeothece verrucosa]ADN16439.1 conserved hypothetical protein [Gloeothece verrucosa PCC 7822]
MSIKIFNPTQSLFVSSSVAILAVCATGQAAFAQTSHGDHHHLMIGVDNLEILNRETDPFKGFLNPNYKRLSLLFPHLHQPVNTSGFHAIGIYGYQGTVSNYTVSNSINNQLPEASYSQSTLTLFPGTGVFEGKLISLKTEANMYSDLKMKPVAHLVPELDDPYVNSIYHSPRGENRWNQELGAQTKIALKLISLTPGLGVADSQGNQLFTSSDTEVLGTGDNWGFTPRFFVQESAPKKTYSATLQLLDVTDLSQYPTHIPWGESGRFTFNFQPVPEPMTILGVTTASLFGSLFKRELSKKPKKK